MKEQIVKLRSEGLTYDQIKEKLGCSKSTISYYCGQDQPQKSFERKKRNREKAIKKRRECIDWLKQLVSRYKSMKGCERCGIKDPRVLDFDHLDPATKKYSIARITSCACYSMETLKTEVRKCRVLCANCHRIHTAEQYNYRTMKHL